MPTTPPGSNAVTAAGAGLGVPTPSTAPPNLSRDSVVGSTPENAIGAESRRSKEAQKGGGIEGFKEEGEGEKAAGEGGEEKAEGEGVEGEEEGEVSEDKKEGDSDEVSALCVFVCVFVAACVCVCSLALHCCLGVCLCANAVRTFVCCVCMQMWLQVLVCV